MINVAAIKRIAYLYLILPFILFSAGWLNRPAAIVVCSIIILGAVYVWRSSSSGSRAEFTRRDLVLLIVILGAWLLFSGVGGYAFQNWDHHSRNAVFRDLINYPWPVVYHLDPGAAAGIGVSPVLMLSYYFGFWMPSALIGKLAGWNAANFFLFLWTFLGIALSVFLTASKLKLTLSKTALLVIFFSGMDFIGVLLLENARGYSYPHLWPPIQHLEWWAGSMQYSSFTTELYWTYNQFAPALLIMSLFVAAPDMKSAVFLGGLCFFFAPLPAIGMFPFIFGGVLGEVLSLFRGQPKRSSFKILKILLRLIFTFENIAGLTIGIVAFFFFSTNLSAQTRSVGLPASPALYLLFILLEWLLLWLLLLPMNMRNWEWYMTGLILTLAPFVNLGGSWDFMMRASIPALYILMLGCGRLLEMNKGGVTRLLVLSVLLAGAFTPAYEINRSIVRTIRYDFPNLSALAFDRYFQSPVSSNQSFIPEFDHPNTLVADSWISVGIPGPEGWTTKVGALFNPFFEILWNRDLILNPGNIK